MTHAAFVHAELLEPKFQRRPSTLCVNFALANDIIRGHPSTLVSRLFHWLAQLPTRPAVAQDEAHYSPT